MRIDNSWAFVVHESTKYAHYCHCSCVNAFMVHTFASMKGVRTT